MISASPAAIDVCDVTLRIREHFWSPPRAVLERVTFSVPEGTLCGFVGANGAGKTTTMQLLLGHLRPTSGRASLFGVPATETRSRLGLGYLPEQPPMGSGLSPLQLVRAHALLRGVAPRRATHAAREALDQVQLGADSNRPTRGFSKGMLQRVSLAQALVGRPRLLLLDEPLSGLDPPGRLMVRELLARVAGTGCTVFFSTHMLSDVMLLCHQVVVLRRGVLTYTGAPEALTAQGASEPMEVVAQGVDGSTCALALELGATVTQYGPRHRFVLPTSNAAHALVTQLLSTGARLHTFGLHGGGALEALVTRDAAMDVGDEAMGAIEPNRERP